jgi:hypothetical protein
VRRVLASMLEKRSPAARISALKRLERPKRSKALGRAVKTVLAVVNTRFYQHNPADDSLSSRKLDRYTIEDVSDAASPRVADRDA